MAEDLILPVPRLMSAVYLVPVALSDQAAKDRAAAGLSARLANPVGVAARIPGMRGIYAGRLRNCGQIEALTANLVSINRRYKAHAGLRVTDI